jgi:hypothetical protein
MKPIFERRWSRWSRSLTVYSVTVSLTLARPSGRLHNERGPVTILPKLCSSKTLALINLKPSDGASTRRDRENEEADAEFVAQPQHASAI